MPEKNKGGNPNCGLLKLKVTDREFLASMRRGNVTQKALAIDVNLGPHAVRTRLKRLIREGKIKKVASAITYGVIDDELQ
jgi:DNA-binding Lrp family transcriptional regulator